MSRRPLRMIKPEIRVVGIDDGRFTPHSKDQVLVVGVVFRGGDYVDGIMSTVVRVDDFDATAKLAHMIISSRHYKQLRVILLNGITIAGFNIVDIKTLNIETHLPVIAVTTRKPNLAKIYKALQNLPNNQQRWNAVLNAGEIYPMKARSGNKTVYVEIAGINKEVTQKILSATSPRSNIPEALRVAHLIASGINLYRS
ncbi:MAG: DUF99 family protein [Candidatus Bathyarchaeota archaeon]|nr:DUF99 family protein [Candidatus Bathyarchaeota archaeon]